MHVHLLRIDMDKAASHGYVVRHLYTTAARSAGTNQAYHDQADRLLQTIIAAYLAVHCWASGGRATLVALLSWPFPVPGSHYDKHTRSFKSVLNAFKMPFKNVLKAFERPFKVFLRSSSGFLKVF